MLHSFQAAEESGAVSFKIPARNHFKVQSPTKLIGTRQSAPAALLVDKSRKIPIESSRLSAGRPSPVNRILTDHANLKKANTARETWSGRQVPGVPINSFA
jgi:hypothetical protein